MTSKWGAFAAYATVSALNQALWLTFAPATTTTAHAYGVSDGAIGLLANVFPLIFVVLSIPAGRMLDERFVPALTTGGALTAAGAVTRTLGHDYAFLLLGQILVAVGQPLLLNAVSATATRYLRPEDRDRGIAFGSAALFLGMLGALLLGAVITASRIPAILRGEAVVTVVAALWLAWSLRRVAPIAEHLRPPAGGLKRLWQLPAMRRLCGLVFLGFGVFVALTTWLQTLVSHAGISSSGAAGMLVGCVVAGALGSALLAPWAMEHGHGRTLLISSAVVTVTALLVLASGPGIGLSAVAVAAIGLVLLADLPLLLTAAEAISGDDAATGTSLIWLAGNAGGIVLALVVQGLLDWPGLAFGAMAFALFFALPLVRNDSDRISV